MYTYIYIVYRENQKKNWIKQKGSDFVYYAIYTYILLYINNY